MKSKVLWGLLILSLVINVAFLSGAFFLHDKADRWQEMPRAERMERMADKMDLTDEQRELFFAIAETRDSPRGRSWRDVREEMSGLLLQEQVAREDFRAILEADRENLVEDYIDRMMATHAFLWSLDEEQRQEVHEMMNDRDSAFRRALRN